MTTNEPYDFSDNDYRWNISVWRPDTGQDVEDCIDVTVEIAEERDYDDDEATTENAGGRF